ncbi:MAG: hypothetical protein R2844_13425 [Caldilineales bacterium]
MKKTRLLIVGVIIGVVLTLGSILLAPSQSLLAIAPASGRQANVSLSNETATPIPFLVMESDELPPAGINLEGSPAVLPTPIPGETLVYFVPTDNDATATVLYLYNTDNVAHVVALRGFSYNGVLVYSLNINVGATSFLRLASDSIVSAPPPSWATPAPVITNFTDFTYFASLSLPRGVRAEGYVLFNPGTGVVDPRRDQGAVPLRFSTDPATLFIPSVQSNR